MNWMVISLTLEEELKQESCVREIQSCDDQDKLKDLCVTLVKQNWHQGKLLRQAVGHIASLDEKMAMS